MKKLATLFFVVYALSSCSIVPLTGRSQLAIFTTQDLMPLVKDEYKETLSSGKVLTSTKEGKQIVKVGNRMAEAVETYLTEQGYDSLVNELDWEFNLLEDEEVNAWCMPGGKVAFYTGILPYTKDETGIAVIMGHELAHAVANHAGERMSQEILFELGVGTIDLAMGQDPTLTQEILLLSVGIASDLKLLSFSRKHELEADRMGLIFMAMAGYDPREAPLFWGRMAEDEEDDGLTFLSTHPGHTKRMERLNSLLPEAIEIYEQRKGSN
ncbi:MAG: M48 family metallopeptidase [Bacteroidota bacterium]|jgi:predicted Zn-dependent protease|nr:M48 family metallopeptidase [Algoriphagus sp.]